MLAKKPSAKSSPQDDALATDPVLRAAAGIQTIRIPWLAKILRVLPWIALIVAFVVLFPGNLIGAPGPQIFGTAVIAVVVVLFAFQTLLARVPETLEALWRRKLILVRSGGAEEEQDPDDQPDLEPEEHAQGYLAYLNEFEGLLNSKRGQLGMLIAFELLVNLWLGFLNVNFLSNLIRGTIGILGLAELVIDMTLAALLAPMAWRLIVIGLEIWRLPLKFDLNVQFEHPDQCGGLEPLGNLCLWNILIISLPLAFLGGWLLIARSDTSSFSFYDTALWESVRQQAVAYADVYAQLLWVLVPFTIMGFILPLWNTHRVMVDKRKEMLVRLDGYIKIIADEWNAAMEKIGNLTVAEGNEKLERLEFAHQIYQRQKNVPVWPINLNIFLKFASTQVLPLLSLTGLGPGIVKILSILIDLIPPSS
ncbi:MAG TPA: hypothetical protein VFZ43_03440 [Anaerolineales bacterium]